MKKFLFICLCFLLFPASVFAQEDPWYLTSFVSDDGQALFFFNRYVYFENKNISPEGMLYKYEPDSTDDMTIWLYDIDDDMEAGSIRLNANKTIVFQETLFRKDESKEDELFSKVERFVQKRKEENERIEQERAKKYQEFIGTNKWVLGIWRVENSPEAFLINEDYVCTYSVYDKYGTQLSAWYPWVSRESSKIIIGLATPTSESETHLEIDPGRRVVSDSEGNQLRKVFP